MSVHKEIFNKIEYSLKNESWFTEDEFNQVYGRFKNYKSKQRTDDEIFEILTMIIFYSGFRAATVERKEKVILGYFHDYLKVPEFNDRDVQRILSDSEMIKNERKIRSCIANAKSFKMIVDQFGSFQNYLDKYEVNNSIENLNLLKEELKYRFLYLGETTVYQFLTDLGFNVLKPDRVILRILNRLGLIEKEKLLLKAISEERKFAIETGLPIRYIDVILVKYGQQGESEMFGLKNGICFEKNPRCNICEVKQHCNFSNN